MRIFFCLLIFVFLSVGRLLLLFRFCLLNCWWFFYQYQCKWLPGETHTCKWPILCQVECKTVLCSLLTHSLSVVMCWQNWSPVDGWSDWEAANWRWNAVGSLTDHVGTQLSNAGRSAILQWYCSNSFSVNWTWILWVYHNYGHDTTTTRPRLSAMMWSKLWHDYYAMLRPLRQKI